MLDIDKTQAPTLQQYDDIFFLDSDAVLVPRLHNRTVSDFYDYWSDKLSPNILTTSHADLLVYGMGEQPLRDIIALLKKGVPFSSGSGTGFACRCLAIRSA